jgi:hypothetical protein
VGCHLRRKVFGFAVSHETHKEKVIVYIRHPKVSGCTASQQSERIHTVRLHRAIGYVAPQAMLAGRQAEIHTERDRKLEEARRQRQVRRLTAGAKTFSMVAGVNPQV